MVRHKLTYTLLALFFMTCFMVRGQRHLIPDVRFNKSSVYVGEPVEVQISIFTSTWFTSAVNPGNIKVNDAFTVYFRSLSTSKQINGQTYAGVVLYFNVFPYNDNDLVFPSLEFTVETPDKGGYKGIKRVVKTPERKLKVKPIPPGFDKDKWLVTTNLSVSDQGLGNIKEVKVGDVLERRISQKVAGTVSELIPPIVWDSIPNVSIYPMRSEVENQKTKTYISASRVDGLRYLFEKEGEVILPEMELSWYNPRTKKLYKRTLKETKLRVLPNPDLGMLETMKDSLQVAVVDTGEKEAEEEASMTILGLTLKEFLIGLFLLLIIIYLGSKLIPRAAKYLKRRKEAYRKSEAFYFKNFTSSLDSPDQNKTINSLYQWIDQVKLNPPTVENFVDKYGQGILEGDIDRLGKYINGEKGAAIRFNKNNWVQARERLLKEQKAIKSTTSVDWVNP